MLRSSRHTAGRCRDLDGITFPAGGCHRLAHARDAGGGFAGVLTGISRNRRASRRAALVGAAAHPDRHATVAGFGIMWIASKTAHRNDLRGSRHSV
jgi:hypothetical protein